MSPRRSVYLKTQNHHVVSRLIFSLTPLQRRIRWTTNFRLYSSMTFQQFKQLCRTSACDQALLLQFHGHYLWPLSRSILSYCTRNFEWESLGSKGNHLCVACWSVCNQDQDFWSAKSVLDHLINPSKVDDLLILRGQRSDCSLYSWSFDFCSLISPQKALIAWFNFDHGCKRFYTGHTSDYLVADVFIILCIHHCFQNALYCANFGLRWSSFMSCKQVGRDWSREREMQQMVQS